MLSWQPMRATDQAANREQVDLPSGAMRGDVTLRLPLPGDVTLELPATLDLNAVLSPLSPDYSCLEAHGSATAPLVLNLPLPDGLGTIDLDLALDATASLRMTIPGQQGLVQAQGRARGPARLVIALPAGSGRISTDATIDTPFTVVVVMPEGRAKLSIQGHVPGHVELHALLPEGGAVDAQIPLDVQIDGMGFLRSGRVNLSASSPIRTTVHLAAIPIPQSPRAMTLDVGVDGSVDLAVELPEHRARLHATLAATIPLGPLLELIRAEVERHVQVEYIELQPPRLGGAHTLELPLAVDVRKGVRARVEVTALLKIDPLSRQLELCSVQARGRNAAGSIASRLFLNRKLFRPLRHTLLFDPATMLPAGIRVDALSFASVDTHKLVIAGEIVYEVTP